MTDFFNSVGMEYVVIGLAAALLLAEDDGEKV